MTYQVLPSSPSQADSLHVQMEQLQVTPKSERREIRIAFQFPMEDAYQNGKIVFLFGEKVRESFAEMLQKNSKEESLSIETDDPDLSLLAPCKQLKRLQVISLSSPNLDPISGLTQLSSLNLSNSINDFHLKYLKPLTNLTFLNLN